MIKAYQNLWDADKAVLEKFYTVFDINSQFLYLYIYIYTYKTLHSIKRKKKYKHWGNI